MVLDHLSLGRYRQAADVVAARLKSVERAHREGHFGNSQFLELVPVNPEGLTTADENLLMRNEAREWHSSDGGWQNYEQGGKGANYQWIPKGKG